MTPRKLALPVASAAALVALSAGVFAFGSAIADTPRDGLVEVKPGMWEWKQETSILGVFNSKERNLECLIPEKAAMTLSRLAYDLDEGCRVENVSPTRAGYTFKLVCKGDVSGKANAELINSNTAMSIRAKGSARWGIIVAGLSMKADATYQGECSPEDYAKAKEKWDEEHAEAS
ncbi:MAG: DUF3617 family protein [Hyphomonadaceae bacterium]